MNRATLILLGSFLVLAFSWAGLVLTNLVGYGALAPYYDDIANKGYPAQLTGLAARGALVYQDLGCAYCHTEQVHRVTLAGDPSLNWGSRESYARDYIQESHVMLGDLQVGPDLRNFGARAVPPPPAPAAPVAAAPAKPTLPAPASAPVIAADPAAAAEAAAVQAAQTHAAALAAEAAKKDATAKLYLRLYDPTKTPAGSSMPAYAFLFETQKILGQPSPDALPVTVEAGYEVVPSVRAKALVGYLLHLNDSYDYPDETQLNTPPAPPKKTETAKPAPTGSAPASKTVAPTTQKS